MDIARVKKRIARLARIDGTPRQGVTRLAYTEADRRARDLLSQWLELAGLHVYSDQIGNMFGRTSREPEEPVVLLGSHLDTVPRAGRYDGCLGVVSALEVVEELRERRMRTRIPLEVVNFACEESARFSSGMIGSRAFAGLLPAHALDDLRDADGVTLREALRRFGLDPDSLDQVRRDPGSIAYYLELHVDQGRALLELNYPIGLVTDIAGAHRLLIEIHGESAHAGAALGGERRDALVAAAHVILAADRITRDATYPWTVATVGRIEVTPGVANVIPGRARLIIEVRGVDTKVRQRAVDEIKGVLLALRDQQKVDVRISEISNDQPVRLDEGVVDLAASICTRLRIPFTRMVSLAGHDAMQVARIARAGLIMVRNRGGVSHAPGERVEDGDLKLSLELLWQVARELAGAA